MTQGHHGDPEREGYGKTKVTDIPADGGAVPAKPAGAPTGGSV